MKKFLCVVVLTLITLSPAFVFADRSGNLNDVKILSVELINGGGKGEARLRGIRVKELERKVQAIIRKHPHAKITTMQSTGRFATQITVIVQY